MGISGRTVPQYILANTERALDAGCDGVIVSPTDEIQRLKELAKGKGKQLLVATPGVRPTGIETNDHRRFGTPSTAIQNGADYLIVGRPIYEQPNPAEAARNIIREMEAAVAEMTEQA
jgi:orotidine-5'-phosphate decarboxylase